MRARPVPESVRAMLHYEPKTGEPSGSGTFTGNATMSSLVFYPQKDQAELNVLSA